MFEDSKARQIEKLIREMDLGNQKPSQLLHQMRELARDKIPDDTLRVLWEGHLPYTVRAVLTVADTKDLDNLATIADNIVDATRPACVSEVAQQSTPRTTGETVGILAEIAKISLRLSRLEQARQPHRRRSYSGARRHREDSSNRSSSRRRAAEDPNWLCFYHYRFRGNGKKCVRPCAWKEPQSQEN